MTTSKPGATMTRLTVVLGSIVGATNTAFASATQTGSSWLDRWFGWLGGGSGGGTTYSVPELDPGAAAGALTLVVGAALVVHARRSRKA